jgi:uncharacterized protein with HEPN domain
MTERARKYLSDILIAIDLIESFVKDVPTFDLYELDYKTQSAVERQLGIIGEAVNQFRKESPEVELENTKQVIGFRNRLIHSYDSIDNTIVWLILNRYLAPLKQQILVMI